MFLGRYDVSIVSLVRYSSIQSGSFKLFVFMSKREEFRPRVIVSRGVLRDAER